MRGGEAGGGEGAGGGNGPIGLEALPSECFCPSGVGRPLPPTPFRALARPAAAAAHPKMPAPERHAMAFSATLRAAACTAGDTSAGVSVTWQMLFL